MRYTAIPLNNGSLGTVGRSVTGGPKQSLLERYAIKPEVLIALADDIEVRAGWF
jgi:hypothetical protein